jgi:hypothetical protein
MWGGVDPDVELFASGVVLEDEGDWATGHVAPDKLAPGDAHAQQPSRLMYSSMN